MRCSTASARSAAAVPGLLMACRSGKAMRRARATQLDTAGNRACCAMPGAGAGAGAGALVAVMQERAMATADTAAIPGVRRRRDAGSGGVTGVNLPRWPPRCCIRPVASIKVLRVRLPIAVVSVLASVAVPAMGSAAAGATAAESLGSLALTLTANRTMVISGGDLRATLVVRSTGTQAATAVTACMTPPPQLSVARATGAQRKGRRVCFALGNLPAGTAQSRAVTLRAVAARTVNVRFTARASSTCRCSARPTVFSPVIRILRAPAKPRVTG